MPLIRLFLDILLFKKGPQDVPGSPLLLGLAAGTDLLAGFALAALETAWLDALLQAITGLGLLTLFLAAALALTGKWSRWLKTASALLGCDALLTSAALPLLGLAQWLPEARGLTGLLLILLLLWQVAVMGAILRHALAVPPLAGIGLALGYTVVSIKIMMALFPAVA